MTTRMGMAYEAFSSSKWGEGFKQLGIGILSILGGGEYIEKGVEYMLSLFDGEPVKDQSGAIQTGGFTSTIKGWINSIGAWISERADQLPIIGGIKRFGNVYNAFSSGDWSGGFKELSLALAAFVGGGPLADGVNMLLDMVSGSAETPVVGKKVNWVDGVKQFIKGKLNKLPYILRKSLSFLGVDVDTTEGEDNSQVTTNNSQQVEKTESAAAAVAASIPETIAKVESTMSPQFERMLELEKTQVQLLTTLVNIGESTYRVLSKMGGQAGGGGSAPPMVFSTSSNSNASSSSMSFYGNRDDYAASPYALA